jgi:hypothetical protein
MVTYRSGSRNVSGTVFNFLFKQEDIPESDKYPKFASRTDSKASIIIKIDILDVEMFSFNNRELA